MPTQPPTRFLAHTPDSTAGLPAFSGTDIPVCDEPQARPRTAAATWLAPLLLTLLPTPALADLIVVSQFNPADINGIVGAAHDRSTDSVWIYPDMGTTLRRYSPAGTFLSSVPRPGEPADDADLDFAPEPFTLASTPIPAGTLLFTNGESGTAEVYAIDPATGTVLATLNTSFGTSHVVGAAYHPTRNTLFLVQDRVPAGTANDSVVAEIDPATGSVLNSFKVDSVLPGFTVNFGDLDVSPTTGNLLIASSDESSIAEFSPAGAFVQTFPLPPGVGGPSGLALVDHTNRAFVTNPSSGIIYQLAGFPRLPGDANEDGAVNPEDLALTDRGFARQLTGWSNGDFDEDGSLTPADYLIIHSALSQPSLPSPTPSIPEPTPLSLFALATPLLPRIRLKSKLYN